MLITEPSLVDSIEVNKKRMVKIHGFGTGNDFEAYITNPLTVDIHGLVSNDVSAALFKKDNFGLSDYAGIPIHGLLGYEFFSRFAVKIDFADSTIKVSLPQHMRYFRKAETISFNLYLPSSTSRILLSVPLIDPFIPIPKSA